MKKIICITVLLVLLTGCSNLSTDDILAFVETEQTSSNYSDYQKFLDKNSRLLSEQIINDFSLRLAKKPISMENTNKCINVCIGEESGIALFFDSAYLDNTLVTYKVQDGKFVDYTIETLYELR